MKRSVEIMAPVGSWESLRTAINAGTDAVYFGLGSLNMRSHSSLNFSLEDFAEIVSICKEAGVKTYLTLNVVIFQEDISAMKEIVDAAALHRIDALIASDMAVIMYAREKGVPVHMSTQVNISNIEAVRYYSQFADVMVLARELNLDQVADIHSKIEEEHITGPSGELVRLEMFVHGALCMAVSGKCYLSLHQYNHSANRGSCFQACRRSYIVTDEESGDELKIDNKYIMSPKDLCTIGFLNKLMDAGVSVFKIEGRARGPEYVNTVVRTYRSAVDAVNDGTYDQDKIEKWRADLSKVFNRGFWNGYYLGQRLGEWNNVYGNSATRVKTFVGKCTNYFSRLGVAEFKMETGSLKIGDEVLITGKTTGLVETTIEEMHDDAGKVDVIEKGGVFSIKVDTVVRRGDQLYLWSEVK